MTSMEIVDPYLTTALKLLHSSAQDSAEKLRIMLDNEITKSHDKSKLVSNLLTKKQLNDEKNAPGSGFKKQKPKKTEEVKVLRPQSPSQEPIPIIDDSGDEGEGAMDDLLDLSCVICRQVESTPNNQLCECNECTNLYHQLCHDPKIVSDNQSSWVCSSCKSKSKSSKSTRFDSPSSSSSSSSNKKLITNVVSASDKKKSSSSSHSQSSSSKRKSNEKSEKSSSSSSSRSRSSKK
jgi:integrator complex subunit 12